MATDLPPSVQSTGIWKRALAARESDEHSEARETLRVNFRRFRSLAAAVAGEISQDLPQFTVHDVSHLDALWGVADTIAGPGFPLNPLECFVLGGAFLLHDLGMALAAWPGREAGLESHQRWTEVHSMVRRQAADQPDRDSQSPDQIRARTVVELLRLLHAEHAERLPSIAWVDPQSGSDHRLIEHERLRVEVGAWIGKIAHSHWWDVERVSRDFGERVGPLTWLPDEWLLDPLKVALLLRVADAAHLDDRRAPRFLRTIRVISGEAALHWDFQSRIAKPRIEDGALIISSTLDFRPEQAAAWWLAYDAARHLDSELRRSNEVLNKARGASFAARSVAGAAEPGVFRRHVRASGWEPVETRLRVSRVPALVRKLGGKNLYGDEPWVALRELVQNAADAVRARRCLERRSRNWGSITASLGEDDAGHWFEVRDDGIGMSTAVLAGPLLDFGSTYWNTTLALEEHPGLVPMFQPAGKFGIGFFSAFMVGEHVRVTSRSVARGPNETAVLEFDSGLDTRPLLRRANASEVLHEPGTSVRVWLSKDPGAEGGLLRGRSETTRSLARVCELVAPALDIDLHACQAGERKTVIRADDWIEMDPEALVARLAPWDAEAPSIYAKAAKDAARRMTLVRNEQHDVIGRAALIIPQIRMLPSERSYWPLASAVVVGGMRCSWDVSMVGVMKGRTDRADRMSGRRIATQEDLERWASEQATVVAEAGLPAETTMFFAEKIYQLGGHVDKLDIAFGPEGPLREDRLRAALAKSDRIRVATFDPRARNRFWKHLDSGVFVAPVRLGEDGTLLANGDAVQGIGALFRSVLVRAWNVPVAEGSSIEELVSVVESHQFKREAGGDFGCPVVVFSRARIK